MDVRKPLNGVVMLGRVLALMLAVFSVFTYVVSLVLGPVLFYSTSDGLTVAARPIHQLPVDIFMALELPVPMRTNLGVLFAGIWATFVLCLVVAGISRRGFLTAVKEGLSKSISLARTNFLYLMPLVATGLLYATILLSQFQETQGVQTGSLNFPPKTSPYLILINLAFAPLNEEFAFRITTIGIPFAIFLLICYRSDPKLTGLKNRVVMFLLAVFSPELAKSRMGHKTVAANGFIRGISPLEWALILVSSVVFGAAHYLLGGGWEIGKVSTAFLAGFVFAIMYVSYGAYADILLHWFFNYYFTVLDMASTAYGSALTGFANIVELTNVVAGQIVLIVFLLISALKLADYFTGRVAGIPSTTS